jgi:hypothetical protein
LRVTSRGLGDVYKRQTEGSVRAWHFPEAHRIEHQ